MLRGKEPTDLEPLGGAFAAGWASIDGDGWCAGVEHINYETGSSYSRCDEAPPGTIGHDNGDGYVTIFMEPDLVTPSAAIDATFARLELTE